VPVGVFDTRAGGLDYLAYTRRTRESGRPITAATEKVTRPLARRVRRATRSPSISRSRRRRPQRIRQWLSGLIRQGIPVICRTSSGSGPGPTVSAALIRGHEHRRGADDRLVGVSGQDPMRGDAVQRVGRLWSAVMRETLHPFQRSPAVFGSFTQSSRIVGSVVSSQPLLANRTARVQALATVKTSQRVIQFSGARIIQFSSFSALLALPRSYASRTRAPGSYGSRRAGAYSGPMALGSGRARHTLEVRQAIGGTGS